VGSGLGQPVAVFLLGNDGVEPDLQATAATGTGITVSK